MIRMLTATVGNWLRNRASISQLSRLSDRELGDLGIDRSDITTVVRQAARLQTAR